MALDRPAALLAVVAGPSRATLARIVWRLPPRLGAAAISALV